MKLSPLQIATIEKAMKYYYPGMYQMIDNGYKMYKTAPNGLKGFLRDNLMKHLVTLQCVTSVDANLIFESLDLIFDGKDNQKAIQKIRVTRGQCYITLNVSGVDVEFLIDTGCSTSILSEVDFEEIKRTIAPHDEYHVKQNGKIHILGINGVTIYPLFEGFVVNRGFVLEKMAFAVGHISLKDSLLGMDFFSKFKSFKISLVDQFIEFEI